MPIVHPGRRPCQRPVCRRSGPHPCSGRNLLLRHSPRTSQDGWLVRPPDPIGKAPDRPTIGARTGHFLKRAVLDIFLTCWTSAGPLRDLGPARKRWKNGGFIAPSGHSGLLRRSLAADGWIIPCLSMYPNRIVPWPEVRKEVQNVQTGEESPHFSSISLLDLCPAEVQSRSSKSRRGPEPDP